MSDFLICGATGYTGSLIAREAVRRGLRPVLAARSADKLVPLAGELELEHRVFPLDTPDAIADGLRAYAREGIAHVQLVVDPIDLASIRGLAAVLAELERG